MLYGGNGNDRLWGGNDWSLEEQPTTQAVIFGGDGDDTVFGSINGTNNVRGEAGNDRLLGGQQNDRLDGGIGDDALRGGYGDDILIGGEGNDVLSGGDGRDRLSGGAGEDVFLFDFYADYQIPDDWNPDYNRTEANDLITDFNRGQDKIFLSLTYFDADSANDFNGPLAFQSLDTSGNGILTDADQGIDMQLVSFMGEIKPSLVIDVSQINLPEGVNTSLTGTITLFGTPILTASDIAG